MSFSAPVFVTAFLPLLAGLHTLFKNETLRNRLLLAAGLVFYAFGGIAQLAVLVAAALVNWLLGIGISRCAHGKALRTVGVVADLALLCAYKYLGFFLCDLLGIRAAAAFTDSIAVSLGISFFTFKCISYLADVSREPAAAARRFSDLLLYVSFFPQILAGPIARFGDFSAQLSGRTADADSVALGFRRFLIGLGKKLFLAFPLALIPDSAFAMARADLGAGLAWLAALAYTLQIFIDFTAYSDMSIGLAGMFGFSVPENFNSPYLADSIGDFWRRWHISLSSWLRDYLYIPLGGNRRGTAAAARNKLIVFALCGLWHGAAWTFLLWGVWHGLLSVLETLRVIPVRRAQKHLWSRVLLHIYTLLAVCLGFVLFRAADLGEAFKVFGAMFSFRAGAVASAVALRGFLSVKYLAVLALSIALCFPLGSVLHDWEQRVPALRPISYALTLVLLLLCLAAMAAQGFQPFIYAQF